MINKISFFNYKAFKEARIEIKPITILLGANSVGKSSIIQFLLLLEQTVEAEQRRYKSPLKLNGNFIKLGEAKNLHREFKSEIPLEFQFDFESQDLLELIKYNLISDIIEGVMSNLSIISRTGLGPVSHQLFLKINSFNERFIKPKKQNNRRRQNINIPKEEFALLINSVSDLLKANNVKIGLIREIISRELFYLTGFTNYIVHYTTKSSIINAYNFLMDLKNEITSKVRLKYSLTTLDDQLKIEKVRLSTSSAIIIDIDIPNKIIRSEFDEFNSLGITSKNSIFEIFNPKATIFGFAKRISKHKSTGLMPFVFSQIFTVVNSELSQSFRPNTINYVSPLRANPKRYYFLDQANSNLTIDTFDGDSIAEILKENKDLLDRINNWLGRYGFEIKIEPVHDIIHKLKVSQNGIELDITDVGFGISQVLPVIIQSYFSRKDSLTIIEQPEIHLHPRMQADLAELFVNIATNLETKPTIKDGELNEAKYSIDKYLIIETHSEYLLKRLRRLIAEGRIKSSDVAIYNLEYSKEEKCTNIFQNKIDQRGFFEWPTDYYGDEHVEDMRKFMEYQKYKR